MSDIAYTVAVIETGHETWDEKTDTSDGHEELPKMTTKFTKSGGLKREYNTMGWSQGGIDFYNKVWEGWKKLSGDNRMGLWEKLESDWFEYVEGTEGKQSMRK